MVCQFVEGDPLLTKADALAFGFNAQGRGEMETLTSAIFESNPAAFSMFRKQCDAGRITAGDYWFWRESTPQLAFLIIRDSPMGATRLRYVQNTALTLARDYLRDGIESLAIAPLGRDDEWPEIKQILLSWLNTVPLPVFIYEHYQPGITAQEDI